MAKKKSAKAKVRKPTRNVSARNATKKAGPKRAAAKSRPARSGKTSTKSRASARASAPRTRVEPPPPPPPRPSSPAVVHWEVQARDPVGQMQFFSDLFGWNVDANNDQQYGMVQAAGAGSIGGGISAMLDAPRTTFYVQVKDIDSMLAKAESMGAQTILPRTDMGMVVMGQFRDREGNLIGLVEG